MLLQSIRRLDRISAFTPGFSRLVSQAAFAFNESTVSLPGTWPEDTSTSHESTFADGSSSSTSSIRQQFQLQKLNGNSFCGFVVSRSFSSSAAVAHEGCGHSHDHGHHEHSASCSHGATGADSVTQALESAGDLQQLQQAVQQQLPAGGSLTAAHVAAALKQAVKLAKQQSSTSPEAASEAAQQSQQLLAELEPVWGEVLPQASIRQLADYLMCMTRLGCRREQLWAATLAAVTPRQCQDAGGQELNDIAYAIAATAEANNGNIPGAPRELVEDTLRAVTQQLVAMVQGPGGISHHTHNHDGDCNHDHDHTHDHGESKGGVTVYHISMVRYAHEVLGL